MYRLKKQNGYSLVELVVVLVIVGILTGIALSSLTRVNDTARYEETKEELDRLKDAIAGNPALVSGGSRTNYGYVGDVGALPPSLNALISNPGGYSTWDGPYLTDDFSTDGSSSHYLYDAWGKVYSYSGGVIIASTGGPTSLTRQLGNSVSSLIYNPVSAVITDIDNSPPGPDYKDSLTVTLIYPNGSGGLAAVSVNPAADGFVEFDSIPIGLHQLRVVYSPADDTLYRRINVDPDQGYHADMAFAVNYWQVTGGGSSGPTIDTVLVADFDSGSESFSYQDDTFRGTSQGYYASGNQSNYGGYSGGRLEVQLGDMNGNDIYGMSGGWQRTFNVPTTGDATLTFYYELDIDSEYEGDEYSQVLAAVDGTLYGNFPNDYIVQLDGDGPTYSTGWQQVTLNLGSLSAGSHTVILGGYNNKKTADNEEAQIRIDNVLIIVSN